MKKLLLFIIFFQIYGCSYFASHLINFENLPTLNGTNGVGTQIFEWVDSTRHEDFTIDDDDYRRLKVQIWYPANISGLNTQPVPY